MSLNHEGRRSMLVTVDERVARLYEVKPTLGKAVDLTELATLTNGHENEHEHGRPDMMGGPGIRSAPGGSGVVGGPHMATPTDSGAEESRRFAREVAGWLVDRPERTHGDRLRVYAASRFLGLLREALKGPKAGHVELKEGELAQIPQHELREHSALRELVSVP